MATLNASELQSIRNECAETLTVNYTKALVNAAAQAVETFLTSNAAAISAAIDAATAPFVFTNAQKKKIVAEVVRLKFERDK
jgi:hypothetical protein